MEIILANAKLRRWKAGDEESLVQQANNQRIWRNLRDRFPNPYTMEDARIWIGIASVCEPQTSFAITVDDLAVGGIGILLQEDVHRRSAEIGYWLGEDYWGRGIVTEAVRRVTDWAFENFDLCRIFAHVFAWNPASMRVLEKAGYEYEGRLRQSVTKDGQTIDQVIYAIIREDGVRYKF
jgi:ribosomal-protein-alanine N-acetyltransferase